jgi:hypothetical protein
MPSTASRSVLRCTRAPVDLRDGVRAPIGTGTGHLAPRQRLGNAVRATRDVVRVRSPPRLPRPEQIEAAELLRSPSVARKDARGIRLRGGSIDDDARRRGAAVATAAVATGCGRRCRRGRSLARGLVASHLLADAVLAFELDRPVAKARELCIQRVERALLLGDLRLGRLVRLASRIRRIGGFGRETSPL